MRTVNIDFKKNNIYYITILYCIILCNKDILVLVQCAYIHGVHVRRCLKHLQVLDICSVCFATQCCCFLLFLSKSIPFCSLPSAGVQCFGPDHFSSSFPKPTSRTRSTLNPN